MGEENKKTENIKKKTRTGLAIASYFLAGIIFVEGQKFSSNPFYTFPLLIVALGAGWLHWKGKFVKRSILRWILLLIVSAFVLGFVAVFFK